MRPVLLILFGIGTLLLRAGFAMQASGSVRAKNAASIIVRTIADTAAAALAFWAFGAAILFQSHNAWIGFDPRFFLREPPEFAAVEFFHLALCVMGSAIVTGALAERSRFYSGAIASIILGGVVFPIAGHWVWFGILRDWNFIDFGGASVIHLAAAVFSAVGVAVLGSRDGKYNRDGFSNSINGHSLPLLGVGTLILFAGWFPYLVGCVCAHWIPATSLDEVILGISATNTLLAAAGGVVGGLIYSYRRYGKLDLFFVFSGLIAGLIAISAGIAAVNSLSAIVIGLVAGMLVPVLAIRLDTTAHLDDPVGLIAVHGTSAIWGLLATALFVPTTFASDHFKLLAIQAGGMVMVIVLSSILAVVVFLPPKAFGWLRSIQSDEIAGLDQSDHGVGAYSPAEAESFGSQAFISSHGTPGEG